jgi:hypothetical protein
MRLQLAVLLLLLLLLLLLGCSASCRRLLVAPIACAGVAATSAGVVGVTYMQMNMGAGSMVHQH